MANIHFSLTENLIIHPVLQRRASPLEELPIQGKVVHFLNSEVVTRVMAFATSFFAAADCAIHLSSCVLSDYRFEHFKQSARFFGIALIGSLAATVWPGILKRFLSGPMILGGGPSGYDSSNTSVMVNRLWEARENKGEFDLLWGGVSLFDKQVFVEIFDRKEKTLKQSLLTDTIYKKVYRCEKNPKWPPQDQSVFYHATSLKGLEGILRSGRVEVRHEKEFRGAFVSTRPEWGFGSYVIVFKRNIERLSPLNHGIRQKDCYWAGFSKDIPASDLTIDHILVQPRDDTSFLECKCKEWTGRHIQVYRYTSKNNNPLLPSEWLQKPDDPLADTIMRTLQTRVAQRNAREAESQSLENGEERVALAY